MVPLLSDPWKYYLINTLGCTFVGMLEVFLRSINSFILIQSLEVLCLHCPSIIKLVATQCIKWLSYIYCPHHQHLLVKHLFIHFINIFKPFAYVRHKVLQRQKSETRAPSCAFIDVSVLSTSTQGPRDATSCQHKVIKEELK